MGTTSDQASDNPLHSCTVWQGTSCSLHGACSPTTALRPRANGTSSQPLPTALKPRRRTASICAIGGQILRRNQMRSQRGEALSAPDERCHRQRVQRLAHAVWGGLAHRLTRQGCDQALTSRKQPQRTLAISCPEPPVAGGARSTVVICTLPRRKDLYRQSRRRLQRRELCKRAVLLHSVETQGTKCNGFPTARYPQRLPLRPPGFGTMRWRPMLWFNEPPAYRLPHLCILSCAGYLCTIASCGLMTSAPQVEVDKEQDAKR